MTAITPTRHPVDRPVAAAPASTGETSPRTAATVAGLGYVALFALAIFANFSVREGLIVSGDATTTAANITGAEGTFRLGLVSFLAVFLLDVAVAWALHVVFRRHHHDLSLLSAWFRLAYTVFLGVAAIFFFQALQLYSGAEFLGVVDRARLDALALVSLELFNSTWLVGLAAFGVHLALMGWLVVRAPWAPRAMGVVLMVAGAAYVMDTVAHTLLPNYADHASLLSAIVIVPSVIAEAWFGLWLLLRAARK